MRDQRNINQLRREIAQLTRQIADPDRSSGMAEMLDRQRAKKQTALDMLLKSARK